MAIKKSDRIKVYEKYGKHCAYCGKVLSEMKDMQVDHIRASSRGGQDDISNYNPSCRRCNHYKRTLNLESFRIYIKDLHRRISNDYITKVGLDYNIVTIKPFDGVFFFEKWGK